MFQVSQVWKETYPGSVVGALVLKGLENPPQHEELDRLKESLEGELRARFAGKDRNDIAALPEVEAYSAYYKKFKKTYHVALQLESIAFKGKSIPRVAALVEAMFMVEVKNLLLTAGHDLDQIRGLVRLEIARGDEQYTLLRGDEQVLKAGDMFMCDDDGVISSIIYGPDRRTCITPATRRAFFGVYAPVGISEAAMRSHLEELSKYAHLVSPTAEVEFLNTYCA